MVYFVLRRGTRPATEQAWRLESVDAVRLARFFVALGFAANKQTTPEGRQFIDAHVSGVRLDIVPAKATAIPVDWSMTLVVDEIAEVVGRAIAAGGSVSRPIMATPDAETCTLKSPEGHLVELLKRTSATVDMESPVYAFALAGAIRRLRIAAGITAGGGLLAVAGQLAYGLAAGPSIGFPPRGPIQLLALLANVAGIVICICGKSVCLEGCEYIGSRTWVRSSILLDVATIISLVCYVAATNFQRLILLATACISVATIGSMLTFLLFARESADTRNRGKVRLYLTIVQMGLYLTAGFLIIKSIAIWLFLETRNNVIEVIAVISYFSEGISGAFTTLAFLCGMVYVAVAAKPWAEPGDTREIGASSS